MADEFDNANSNRVRAIGRAYGKNTMLNPRERRDRPEGGSIGAVEPVQDNKVKFLLYILQTFSKFWQDF